jgi:hypothetical protein
MLTSKLSGLVIVFAILGLTPWLAPTVSLAGDFAGHVNFLVGQKALEKNDWLPLEQQVEVGVEGTWGREGWPVWIATDFYRSQDSARVLGSKVEAETRELGVGIRRVWNNDNSYLYLGFGVDYLSARVEQAAGSEDQSNLGGWMGGGLFWRLGPRANIGVALRYSNGRVTLFDEATKVGGIQSGILLGWGWPAAR